MLTFRSGTSDKSRRRLHRRLTGLFLLLFGLALAGCWPPRWLPSRRPQADQSQSALIRNGQQLYGDGLHQLPRRQPPESGPRPQPGRRVSRVFFRSTPAVCRMVRGGSVPRAKRADLRPGPDRRHGCLHPDIGGGPLVPRDANEADRRCSVDRQRRRPWGGPVPAELRVAQLHQSRRRTSGKYAPASTWPTPRADLPAMLTGPQNMPVLRPSTRPPREKKDIIAYVRSSSQTMNLAATASVASARCRRAQQSRRNGGAIAIAMWIGARA